MKYVISLFMIAASVASSFCIRNVQIGVRERRISQLKKNRREYSMAIKGPIRYSTGDWLNCIATLPTSRILHRTKYNILFFTLFSAFLTWLSKFKLVMFLPATVHSIAGAALSLLLVFRTNASYDRYLWDNKSVISKCMHINVCV